MIECSSPSPLPYRYTSVRWSLLYVAISPKIVFTAALPHTLVRSPRKNVMSPLRPSSSGERQVFGFDAPYPPTTSTTCSTSTHYSMECGQSTALLNGHTHKFNQDSSQVSPCDQQMTACYVMWPCATANGQSSADPCNQHEIPSQWPHICVSWPLEIKMNRSIGKEFIYNKFIIWSQFYIIYSGLYENIIRLLMTCVNCCVIIRTVHTVWYSSDWCLCVCVWDGV